MCKVKIIKGKFRRCEGIMIGKHSFLKDNYVILLDNYNIKTVIYKDDFVKIEE